MTQRRLLPAAHPEFGLFWLARVGSTLGFQMQTVAVGWQVYALTHSVFQLGMVGLVEFLPMAILILPAGHAVDRFDRRLICAGSFAAQALAVGVLGAGAWGHWMGVSGIFAWVAVLGASAAFARPANQALMPALVPEAMLPRAVAWASGGFQCAAVVGPALGGVLYACSPAGCYATAAALSLGSAGLVFGARGRPLAQSREPATLKSVFAGIGFIRRNPIILGSISLDLFAVLLGGATALMPVFADLLHAGPIGNGILRAAPAAGSIGTSVYLAYRPLERRVGTKMFAAVILFGLSTVAFGLSRSLPFSIACLVVMGASDMVSVVVRASLVQLRTPDEMRGRVSAVNSLFIGTSNQLGEFESGVTAALMGPVIATMVGGLGTLAVAVAWMRLFPDLARFDRLRGFRDR